MHKSVLLDEVISFLDPQDGRIYVDGNLGLGGHTEKILEKSGPHGRVIAFDWDQIALELARKRLSGFSGRVDFIADNFASMPQKVVELGVGGIDGILLDLGLSSYQLDYSERGFSFKKSQPLDMRMDKRRKVSAEYLVNNATEGDLADIFYSFGEERQARRIASFVVERRKNQRIEHTDQLVDVIEKAVPRRYRPKKIHVATKVFQALRIAVNTELDNLAKILIEGPKMLKNDAKFCVITFHSLEDRLVKRAFQNDQTLEVLTKKVVSPSEEELKSNPRARSAKLRVAKKMEGA